MKKLFSNERVNGGRQVELDLAKCLSIIFMIFLHCLMVTGGFNNNVSPVMQKAIGQLLGEPFAAPVFMFAMGVGMVYSRNQAPAYLIKRGISLMILGLVVNVGEFFLPHFLAGKLLGASYAEIFPIAGGLLLYCIDILAFAGMAFIVIGMFKKLKMKPAFMILIALVFSVTGWILRERDLGNDVLNLVAGYFFGSAGGFTAFPLFNWLIFPTCGILFGEYYSRCNNKKKLLCLSPVGLIISVTYFVLSWNVIPNGFLSTTHNYYFMTTIDAIACLLCIYGVIGLCYFVSLILPQKLLKFISKTSSNLNAIYVIQWFLIPITYILICFFKKDIVFGNISLVIISVLEIAVAIALASAYKSFVKSRKEKRNEKNS